MVRRHGDGWKVRVAAPAERGRANKTLLTFLAAVLEVPPTAVRLVAGQNARRKIVEIDGLDEEDAGRRLEAAAQPYWPRPSSGGPERAG